MKWLPDKLGGDNPKKLVFLGALLLVLGYFLFSNLGGGSSNEASPQPRAASKSAVDASVSQPGAAPAPKSAGHNQRATLEDFRPSLNRAREAAASDPTRVDPTLRLDLLVKLQNAKFEGNMRSVFEFGQAPSPPPQPNQAKPTPFRDAFIGPRPVPPAPPPPPPPPPPQIPLKFYGFVNPARPDVKRAFFMDGDEILVAGEGDTVRNRYRIVRIGVSSAVVEDTQYKDQQTLQLVAEEQG
jgi:hypothetical protein